METHGSWTEEDGMRVWRLGVQAEGATSWSFYLSRFVVPKGGELFVWNGGRTHFMGAFNHLNVKEWEGLALSVMEGSDVVLEYREPLNIHATGEIELLKWSRDTALCFAGRLSCKPKCRLLAPLETAAPATSMSTVLKETIGKSKTSRSH